MKLKSGIGFERRRRICSLRSKSLKLGDTCLLISDQFKVELSSRSLSTLTLHLKCRISDILQVKLNISVSSGKAAK